MFARCVIEDAGISGSLVADEANVESQASEGALKSALSPDVLRVSLLDVVSCWSASSVGAGTLNGRIVLLEGCIVVGGYEPPRPNYSKTGA